MMYPLLRKAVPFLALLGVCAQLAVAQQTQPPGQPPAAQQPPAQQSSTQQPSAQQPVAKGDPRVEVASRIPGTKPEELRATPIAGMYELAHGADIAYVSADGKYAITGDLYDLGKSDNLTETRRRELRARMMAAFPESEMVIFGPKDPKYTVTVFTDVDCAYCRKLHSQIAEYNRLGVRVRYLLYPRTEPGSPSWIRAEQVWCSADRNAALTKAKLGQELTNKPCTNNPVARIHTLGQDFALSGTPDIVLPSGEMFPGYIPPDVLVQHLREEQQPPQQARN
jgi:thiol:disulfide interchange protein DsbC